MEIPLHAHALPYDWISCADAICNWPGKRSVQPSTAELKKSSRRRTRGRHCWLSGFLALYHTLTALDPTSHALLVRDFDSASSTLPDQHAYRLSETSRQEISEILREFYLGGEGVELADRNPPTAHLSHINVDIPYRLESYMR